MLQKCRKVYIVRKGFTVPHPFTQHILHFCFPTLFSIQPCFKTFYTAPPIPLHSYQSIILIQHTNLPYTITLKISISRNQPNHLNSYETSQTNIVISRVGILVWYIILIQILMKVRSQSTKLSCIMRVHSS